jgi:hypothetical protein
MVVGKTHTDHLQHGKDLQLFGIPPIPATMKPLTLICVFLIAVQTVNNLIIDWKNPKEKQYDPVKDLK